jgi:hypothetical protein
MAGSTIVDFKCRDKVRLRGLVWRRWRGGSVAVDRGKHISDPAAPGGAKAIDSPSGSSMYVTRALSTRSGIPALTTSYISRTLSGACALSQLAY